jgi:hypothetical protein
VPKGPENQTFAPAANLDAFQAPPPLGFAPVLPQWASSDLRDTSRSSAYLNYLGACLRLSLLDCLEHAVPYRI